MLILVWNQAAEDGVDVEGRLVCWQSVQTEPEARYTISWVKMNLIRDKSKVWWLLHLVYSDLSLYKHKTCNRNNWSY